jgi:hypothetical protein
MIGEMRLPLSLYRAVSPFMPPLDVVEEGDEIPMKG